MPRRLLRDRLLLAILLAAMVFAYAAPYLRSLGHVTVASVCDYLAAIAQATAVVLVLVDVLKGLADRPAARSAAGCSDDDQGRGRLVAQGDEPVG